MERRRKAAAFIGMLKKANESDIVSSSRYDYSYNSVFLSNFLVSSIVLSISFRSIFESIFCNLMMTTIFIKSEIKFLLWLHDLGLQPSIIPLVFFVFLCDFLQLK